MQTKIVLSRGSRRIELEGTQEFVEAKLNELIHFIDENVPGETEEENERAGERSTKGSSGDESPEGSTTLKKFIAQKAPKNTYQAIACVLFHARKYKNSEEQSVTEIRNGLIHGKFRPPGDMNQALTDCRRKYGYIEVGTKKGLWKLTHEGETTVEFDLSGSTEN